MELEDCGLEQRFRMYATASLGYLTITIVGMWATTRTVSTATPSQADFLV